MAEVPDVPRGLGLPAQELRIRESLLAGGGPLASAMRAVEAREWRTPGWLTLCWLWVQFLVVVRGFRGATTVADYVEAVARFVGWVDEQRLDLRALQVRDLDNWQKWLYMRRKLSVSARRQALMAVRSLFGYMAVDAVVRAMAGKEPAHFLQPVFLVVKENVDSEGGKDNEFVPSNNFACHYRNIWTGAQDKC